VLPVLFSVFIHYFFLDGHTAAITSFKIALVTINFPHILSRYLSGLSIICLLPRIIYEYLLQGFGFATWALSKVYSILLHHTQLQWYFHQAFMQRQFHLFEHFIYSAVPVSVTQIPIGSYFGKSLR